MFGHKGECELKSLQMVTVDDASDILEYSLVGDYQDPIHGSILLISNENGFASKTGFEFDRE